MEIKIIAPHSPAYPGCTCGWGLLRLARILRRQCSLHHLHKAPRISWMQIWLEIQPRSFPGKKQLHGYQQPKWICAIWRQWNDRNMHAVLYWNILKDVGVAIESLSWNSHRELNNLWDSQTSLIELQKNRLTILSFLGESKDYSDIFCWIRVFSFLVLTTTIKDPMYE